MKKAKMKVVGCALATALVAVWAACACSSVGSPEIAATEAMEMYGGASCNDADCAGTGDTCKSSDRPAANCCVGKADGSVCEDSAKWEYCEALTGESKCFYDDEWIGDDCVWDWVDCVNTKVYKCMGQVCQPIGALLENDCGFDIKHCDIMT